MSEKICDLDVAGRIDHIPGRFEMEAVMNTNTRVPQVLGGFRMKNLALGQPGKTAFQSARVQVTDDEHPAFLGPDASAPWVRVPNYDISLKGIGPSLYTKLEFQGNESLPKNLAQR